MYSRKNKTYTHQELDQLLLGVNLNTPISELEAKLGRPASGIIWKMRVLSQQDPNKWNYAYVLACERQYAKQRKYPRGQYYQDNKAEMLKKAKIYYNQHKKEIRKYQKEYQKRQKEHHPEEIKLYHRQYYQNNKGKWKIFGDYLFQLLKDADKTWKEISSELKVDNSTLSHYLSGNKKPTKKFIVKMSKRFNISREKLQDLLE